MVRHIGRLGAAAVLAASACSSAFASIVGLGVDPALVAVNGTVMDSRYRLSQTNWDQMIAYDTVISTTTIVQQQGLGDAATLNNRAWNFSMSYVAGSGYTFTLTDTSLPPLAGSPSTVAWTAPKNGVSATRSFNAIELFAQAQNGLQPGVTAHSIAVTNLAFSGAGLSTSGTLANMSDTHLLSPTLGLDYAQQWLVADTDLSLFNWVLTGTVQASFAGSVPSNFGESIKFDIKAVQASVVPLPPAVALMAAGIALLGGVARRRSHRAA